MITRHTDNAGEVPPAVHRCMQSSTGQSARMCECAWDLGPRLIQHDKWIACTSAATSAMEVPRTLLLVDGFFQSKCSRAAVPPNERADKPQMIVALPKLHAFSSAPCRGKSAEQATAKSPVIKTTLAAQSCPHNFSRYHFSHKSVEMSLPRPPMPRIQP